MFFKRNQIRRQRGTGYYYFQCRKCKNKGYEHYGAVSAVIDKEKHRCAQ
jgi:hypothetical protein